MICVIFDLDGTLTDSHEGILKSIRHALTSMNHPIPDEDTLQLFIGPPLADSFKEHCHMTDEEVEQAYNFFKERYDSVGKYENASCHLALGAAYPTCLAHSDGLSQEELHARGLNTSLAHTDFMIGHEKMNIMGTTKDGKEVPIMIKGRLQV